MSPRVAAALSANHVADSRYKTTMSRRHGREKSGTRDIKITYDGLARADGSARFGFGKYYFSHHISFPISCTTRKKFKFQSFDFDYY